MRWKIRGGLSEICSAPRSRDRAIERNCKRFFLLLLSFFYYMFTPKEIKSLEYYIPLLIQVGNHNVTLVDVQIMNNKITDKTQGSCPTRKLYA